MRTTNSAGPEPRILVVEDEAVVAIDIRSQLESLGYRVVGVCAQGRDAVEQTAALEPDLVLMDIQLQGEMDGIEAAETIREMHGVPVIFLTAYADETTLRRAKISGPHGYILKPFDERDLNTTVEIALSRARSERTLQRSRDDLAAVLDAQRHGAVAVGGNGDVTFVSRAACQVFGLRGEQATGKPWEEVLRLPEEAVGEIRRACRLSGESRSKIPAECGDPAGERRSVEIEVVDDPREEGGFILFLYDVSDLRDLRRLLDAEARFESIVGESAVMRRVFQIIADVARVDSSVVVEGETGTGKELVARAIHRRSGRSGGPFIPVNCGGLSVELAASQFFGHVRGSFTGAVADQAGLFEAADGGTLFLDEIGELPLPIQTTLLRVLEDGCVTRVGEARQREVDVRVIAATSRNLKAEIEAGTFRADLFYRISVARIELPALRRRLEDLPLLVRRFLAEARAKTGKGVHGVSDEALRTLLACPWPGNVRQLKNAVEFSVIRARRPEIQPEDLPNELLETMDVSPPDGPAILRAALAQAHGNRKKAAELLGVSRTTFYRRLARYGLGGED